MLLTNLRPSVPYPILPLEVYNKRSTSHNKQTQLSNLGPGQAAHLPLLFPLCSVVSHVVVLPVRNPRELHSPLAFRFETMATCALLLLFHIFQLIRTFGTNTKSVDCGYQKGPVHRTSLKALSAWFEPNSHQNCLHFRTIFSCSARHPALEQAGFYIFVGRPEPKPATIFFAPLSQSSPSSFTLFTHQPLQAPFP